jgi:hypothetical protein
MGSWWITFSIVMWLPPLGVLFLVVLESPGLCLEVLLICLIVGGPMAGLGVLWYEKWCLRASSGVYGRKGMIGSLRIERMLSKILSFFYEILYLWTAAYMSPLSVSFNNFLVCLGFLLYILLTYQKIIFFLCLAPASQEVPFVYFQYT